MIFKSCSQFTAGSFRDTANKLVDMLYHRPYSYWNYTELANSRKLWAVCVRQNGLTHTGGLSLIPVRIISICCKPAFRAQWVTVVITRIKKITSYVASTNIWTNKHNVKRQCFAYWRRITFNFRVIYVNTLRTGLLYCLNARSRGLIQSEVRFL